MTQYYATRIQNIDTTQWSKIVKQILQTYQMTNKLSHSIRQTHLKQHSQREEYQHIKNYEKILKQIINTEHL